MGFKMLPVLAGKNSAGLMETFILWHTIMSPTSYHPLKMNYICRAIRTLLLFESKGIPHIPRNIEFRLSDLETKSYSPNLFHGNLWAKSISNIEFHPRGRQDIPYLFGGIIICRVVP
jgi:hypothetical protein